MADEFNMSCLQENITLRAARRMVVWGPPRGSLRGKAGPGAAVRCGAGLAWRPGISGEGIARECEARRLGGVYQTA